MNTSYVTALAENVRNIPDPELFASTIDWTLGRRLDNSLNSQGIDATSCSG
jgi:hypothetical protein